MYYFFRLSKKLAIVQLNEVDSHLEWTKSTPSKSRQIWQPYMGQIQFTLGPSMYHHSVTKSLPVAMRHCARQF